MSSENQDPKSKNLNVDVPTTVGLERISNHTTNKEAAMPIGSKWEAVAAIALVANTRMPGSCPIDVMLPKLAEQTARSKVSKRINKLVAERFVDFMAGQKLQKIDIWDVAEAHASEWLAGDRAKYNLSVRTFRRYAQALDGMFDGAFKKGLIPTNVVRLVKLPQPPKLARRRPFSDPELVQTYLAGDEEWQEMTITGSVTGMRLDDVSLAVVANIDFITGFLRPVVRKTNQIEPKPLPSWMLERWKTKYEGMPSDTPLFPRAYKWMCSNGELTSSRAASEFKNLLIRAGVRKPDESRVIEHADGEKYLPLTFGCLRHNFIEQLKKAAVSESMIRRLMGYKSEAVSHVYERFDEKAAKAVVEQLRNPLKELVTMETKKGIVAKTDPAEKTEKKPGHQNQ